MSEPKPELLGFKGKPIVKGSETIYEIIKKDAGLGFGLALVRIEGEWNEPHFHKEMREVYVVIWGDIEIKLVLMPPNGVPDWGKRPKFHVGSGSSVVIAPRRAHQTRAIRSRYAWFYVFTFPPFDQSDYYPTK